MLIPRRKVVPTKRAASRNVLAEWIESEARHKPTIVLFLDF